MLIFAIIFVFMVLLGGLTLSYQIFKLVALDAESRGLKHPKLWGMFSLSGNHGARIYTITMIQPVANKINRKHLLTNFRSSVFAI